MSYNWSPLSNNRGLLSHYSSPLSHNSTPLSQYIIPLSYDCSPLSKNFSPHVAKLHCFYSIESNSYSNHVCIYYFNNFLKKYKYICFPNANSDYYGDSLIACLANSRKH